MGNGKSAPNDDQPGTEEELETKMANSLSCGVSPNFLWKHLCNDVIASERQKGLGGTGHAQCCLAASAVLGADGATVVGSFDNGSMGAWSLGSGEPVGSVLYPAGQSAEQIVCLDLAANECGLEEVDNGPGNNGYSFCAGTSGGSAMIWTLKPGRGLLAPSLQWRACTSTPNSCSRFSGVSSASLGSTGVVTGGSDGSCVLWTKTGLEKRRVEGAHRGAVTAVASAAPMAQAVTAGEEGCLRIWSERCDAVLRAHARDGAAVEEGRGAAVSDLCLDLQYRRVCAGCEDGFVRVWDMTTGGPTRRLHHASMKAKPKMVSTEMVLGLPPADGVSCVAFDDAEVPVQLVSGGVDGSWKLWDIRQEEPAHTSAPSVFGPRGQILSIKVRGWRLLTASADGWVRLWDLRGMRDVDESLDLVDEVLPPGVLEEVYMLGLQPPKARNLQRRQKSGCAALCAFPLAQCASESTLYVDQGLDAGNVYVKYR